MVEITPTYDGTKEAVYKHIEKCIAKDNTEVIKRNIIMDDQECFAAEYDAYCSICDAYLYSYSWGKKYFHQ